MTYKMISIFVLAATALSACAIPPPKDAAPTLKPPVRIKARSAAEPVRLERGADQLTEYAREIRNILPRSNDEPVIVFVNSLRNASMPDGAYLSPFGAGLLRDVQYPADTVTRGSNMMTPSHDPPPGEWCRFPEQSIDALFDGRRFFMESELSAVDFDTLLNSTQLEPFGSSGRYEGDAGLGSGNASDRFYLWTSIRDCNTRSDVVSERYEIEVDRANRTVNLFAAGISIGVFAFQSKREAHGLNAAKTAAVDRAVGDQFLRLAKYIADTSGPVLSARGDTGGAGASNGLVHPTLTSMSEEMQEYCTGYLAALAAADARGDHTGCVAPIFIAKSISAYRQGYVAGQFRSSHN